MLTNGDTFRLLGNYTMYFLYRQCESMILTHDHKKDQNHFVLQLKHLNFQEEDNADEGNDDDDDDDDGDDNDADDDGDGGDDEEDEPETEKSGLEALVSGSEEKFSDVIEMAAKFQPTGNTLVSFK